MCFRFSEIHHHWTGAMGAHLCMIPIHVDKDGRYGVLRQLNLSKGLLQVLHMILHSALDSSRDAIVDDGIMGKKTSIYIPFTIVHCVAVARQNVLDLNAV